jgi:hypothetical protein
LDNRAKEPEEAGLHQTHFAGHHRSLELYPEGKGKIFKGV